MNTKAMLYITYGNSFYILKKSSIVRILYGVKQGNFKNQNAIGIVYENVSKELELILKDECSCEIGKRIRDELVKLSLRTWWSSKINLNEFIEKLQKESNNDAD